MTLPEVLLWQQVRGQKLGVKFRRQHPVGPYVADFCCMAAKLIVEIDGEAHNCGANPVRDAARDAFLSAQGFEIVRIAAKDVLEEMALASEKVQRSLDGAPIRKIIVVPDRLVNIVT